MPKPKPIEMSQRAYLAFESESSDRHEYVAGAVYAMVGGTFRHSVIAATIARLLGNHLAGKPCHVAVEGAKVHVKIVRAFYYPDVVVRCSPASALDRTWIDDPTLIVEVPSPSTETTDRREKLHAYRKLASLREYVIVAQDERSVEVWRRAGDVGWTYHQFGPAEAVQWTSVEMVVDIGALYEGAEVG